VTASAGQPVGRVVVARLLRGFADGLVSVLLATYLSGLGFTPFQVGAVVTGTLVGSAALTLAVGLLAPGRSHRTVLLASSALMASTGLGFATASAFWVVLAVAVAGTLNPTTGDVSVFLPTEQAYIADRVEPRARPRLYARYNLAGSLAGAVGALVSAAPERLSDATGWSLTTTQRFGFVAYSLVALALALLYHTLPLNPPSPTSPPPPAPSSGPAASVPPSPPTVPSRPAASSPSTVGTVPGVAVQAASEEPWSSPSSGAPSRRQGWRRPRRIVLELAALFSLDSAGGGLVVTSLLVLWLKLRFDLDPATTGAVFFGAGLLTGASQLLSGPLAARIGLIRTMSFTHLPANGALILAAFAPTPGLAVGLLLFRAALSQMDVPARQSFVMAVVPADERAAAASITNVPRSLASATTPLLAGALLGHSSFGWPLVLAGLCKGTYDLLLLFLYRHVPESPGAERR
jgi:MFS family permease